MKNFFLKNSQLSNDPVEYRGRGKERKISRLRANSQGGKWATADDHACKSAQRRWRAHERTACECRSPSSAEHSSCPAAGISRIDQPPSRVFLFLRPSPRIINVHRSFLLFISWRLTNARDPSGIPVGSMCSSLNPASRKKRGKRGRCFDSTLLRGMKYMYVYTCWSVIIRRKK